jgi:hypothetical protein
VHVDHVAHGEFGGGEGCLQGSQRAARLRCRIACYHRAVRQRGCVKRIAHQHARRLLRIEIGHAIDGGAGDCNHVDLYCCLR